MKHLIAVFILLFVTPALANIEFENSPSVADVRAMTYRQLQDLNNLGTWSPEAIEALGTNIRYVRPQAFTLVRDIQFTKLNRTGWQSLSEEQVRAMTGGMGGRFSQVQFNRLSDAAKRGAGAPRTQTRGYIEYPEYTGAVETPRLADLPVGGATAVDLVVPVQAVEPVTRGLVVNPVVPVASVVVSQATAAQSAAIIAASGNDRSGADGPGYYESGIHVCEWSEDLPRKIATGPNLCTPGTRPQKLSLCVGYAVCNTTPRGTEGTPDYVPSIKFLRMATCPENYCDDVSDCLGYGRGFGSSSAQSEESVHVSELLRSIIAPPDQD